MNPIRVLIIDDSAFARKALREVLSSDREIEVVGIARDGIEGLEKICELRPDVVTLDLIMPDLDGLGVLKALKEIWSPKVIVVSVSGGDSELALKALENGAVDVVTKPTALASDRLYELSAELVAKVKIAASARPRLSPLAVTARATIPPWPSTARLLVIGTSTGGPQALTELFMTLPHGLPFPIAVALHIPEGYTVSLAQRISSSSAIRMVEARDGMEILPGQAVIAPGGRHLKIRADEHGHLFAIVTRAPEETLHHPSVDVLFQSAAESVGSATIAMVLTGMGSDGLIGSGAIRRAGGRVLAESASSCVVYGMPRTVIEAGLASGEAPLEGMQELLMESIYGGADV